MRRWAFLLVAIFMAAGTSSAAPKPETQLVVAIRYLQAKGTSHSHLYLYREDGKLVRQLTTDDSGQDIDPLFAPDGETIVFSREKPNRPLEFWSITPTGAEARRLSSAPDWYANTKNSPYFTNRDVSDAFASTNVDSEGEGAPDSSPPSGIDGDPPRTYRAPDGSVEVVVRRLASDEDDSVNGEGTGKHFILRDLNAAREVEMGALPGFVGLWDVLHLAAHPTEVYLFDGNLRVVFFGLHLDSTNGDTVFALDLNRSVLERLSPNWAAPIPLPGDAAFLTLTYNRYVPIPGSPKTANCTYLERWDAKLKKVRYARPGMAAICYGASMHRPGKTPVVIRLRRDGD